MGDGSQNSDPWEPSSLWWSSHGIDSGPGLLAKHKESPCVHGTSGTLSVIRQKVWTKYADMHHTAVWAMQTGYNFIQYWHYSTLMYFIINKQQEHFFVVLLDMPQSDSHTLQIIAVIMSSKSTPFKMCGSCFSLKQIQYAESSYDRSCAKLLQLSVGQTLQSWIRNGTYALDLATRGVISLIAVMRLQTKVEAVWTCVNIC